MSTFLAPYFNDVPLGYSRVPNQNVIVGQLTANGWQLLAQVDGVSSDLIPPATETIGTSTFREVVRLYFPDDVTLKIGSYQVCIADAFPQQIMIKALTAGAVQAGMTINGMTVLGALGVAGSTANQNLQALFYALKDSADPTISGWDHWYNGSDTIVSTCKTKVANVACSGNANVTYSALGSSVLAGARSGYVNVDATIGYPITYDLTNGYVLYMAVFSRTVLIGSKTLTGKFGGVFASYVDHAEALAAMPDNSAGLCTPIELIVGAFNEATSKAYGRPTHWWIIPTGYANNAIPATEAFTPNVTNSTPTVFDAHPFTGAAVPQTIMDGPIPYRDGLGTNYGVQITFSEMDEAGLGSSYSGPSMATSQYKVVSVSASSITDGSRASYSNSIRFFPTVNLPDVTKWNGSEPDETCAMGALVSPVGINGLGLTLQQALDDTTAYSTFLLSGTTGLSPSGGGFILGQEEFTYTGLSGNSPTGISRAQNGTVAARHFIGDVATPIVWFLKLNNSAICAGSAKPV